MRGLHALADWAEQLTARIGTERGEDLHCGGIVINENIAHAAALEQRGYVPVAKVYGKRIAKET
jgi:hypothetical protein